MVAEKQAFVPARRLNITHRNETMLRSEEEPDLVRIGPPRSPTRSKQRGPSVIDSPSRPAAGQSGAPIFTVRGPLQPARPIPGEGVADV